jgi:hypothetical protein
LLIHQGGLVKTQAFKDAKYVGDPINAVRIFKRLVDARAVAFVICAIGLPEISLRFAFRLCAVVHVGSSF